MGLAQLEWNSTFCTVERGGCGCFWSQSVSGSWTESHLCFVAHLHLQKAAWVGMLIRCVHLRTNPLEYYDNIWQTSSPEWQGWPTAAEHDCLSRKHRSFDVLHTTDLPTKYPVEGSCVLYLPSNIIQLLAWRARFWMCSESFHNIWLFFLKSWMENLHVSLRSSGHMLHQEVSKHSLKKFYVENSGPYLRKCSLLP